MSPPGQSDYGKCKHCGAEIVWLKMASGANMPADPTQTRTLVDRGDGRYQSLSGYTPHWATCPKADQARKR